MFMNIHEIIAKELEIKVWQVEAAVKLIDEGNTIPFIARYRKEAHGTLNDEKLRQLDERLTYLRNAFSSFLITGPFSIVLGFDGGLMALNDRLKLRSMVTGEKDDLVFIASEEAAIRVMAQDAVNIQAPAGGEPFIVRVKECKY